MKQLFKWILPFSLLIYPAVSTFAQQPLEIRVSTPEAENSQPYFTVDIPNTSFKEVQNDWKNYIKKGSNGEGNLINGEYIQTGVVNKTISTDPFSAYAAFQQMSESVNLKVWLKQNNQPFPSENNYESVKKLVRDFAVMEYRNSTQERLKTEKAKLSNLEDQLASINKADNKSIKNSERDTRSNERSAESINANKAAIDNSAQNIENQDKMITQTSADKNANNGAKKTMKQMENDKRDLEKQNEKESRKIDDRNEKNRESERNRTLSQSDRTRIEAEIETQKQLVLNIQQELSLIN